MENEKPRFVWNGQRAVRVIPVGGRDTRELNFDQIYSQEKNHYHFDFMEYSESVRRRKKESIAEAEDEFRKAFNQVYEELQKNIGICEDYKDFEERLKTMEGLRDMFRIFQGFKSALIEEIG